MSRGSRHVHYDDEAVGAKKKHKGGSHNRRQRRRRRVSRRAKVYGAAFLLALTGFFCLVPGTSLTIVAFTNGTDSRESILRLLGPVFAGVGIILIGISVGLLCYAALRRRRSRGKGGKEHAHAENGYQAGGARDGESRAAEVRLLDAVEGDSDTRLKVKCAPESNNKTGPVANGNAVVVDGVTITDGDGRRALPSVTVSMVGSKESINSANAESPTTKESFQVVDVNEANALTS